MSGICGWVGSGAPDAVLRMLAVIDYRGDSQDILAQPGMALGYRFFSGRPGKAAAILETDTALVACAGTFAPATEPPPQRIAELLAGSAERLELERFAELDGAFAFAHWNKSARVMTLARDPFGVRSLYYVEHRGTLYFATELKQILTIDGLAVEVDAPALHKYLTFSFVPGESVPIRGIRRLLPGHVLRWRDGMLETHAYFRLSEQIDEQLRDTKTAVRTIRRLGREATQRRLYGSERVGLFLSGGLDSASVAVWLEQCDADVHVFSLDFGEKGVEREQASAVAKLLGFEQTWVPVTGERIAAVFEEVVHRLDLPFGDPVTVPQYLLGRAARAAGASAVFNGEGGDQLFGGWTSKPMIAAEVYAGLYESEPGSREEAYLRSYHRFYGLEDQLYSDDFKRLVGPTGQRRAHLQPYLRDGAESFLHRVRLADISLKGSQNILPRAERMANGWGLDVRTPLFDRKLAETAFRLPPELKLHGATEKYVLKLAMQRSLPREIVWRRKFGMSVPVTDFVLTAPLSAIVEEHLNDAAVSRRGYFRPEFVRALRAGHDVPGETRRRRVGERVWALLMLEAWLRRFVDARGSAPGAAGR
jgi:asparagine synthase (glutamine-hydrolysing)